MKDRHMWIIIAVIIVIAGFATFLFSYLSTGGDSTGKNGPQFLYELTGSRKGQGLKEPVYALTGQNGNVYVSDAGNRRVKVFTKKGKFLRELGGPESGKTLIYPYGIALLGNHRVIVADPGAGALYEFDSKGKYVRTWLDKEANAEPAVIFVSSGGKVFVTDLQGNQILEFSSSGSLLQKIKPGQITLKSPQGLAVNGDGTIWVADGGNYNIKLLAPNGELKTIFDGGPKLPVTMVKGLAVDSRGRIYVADTLSNEIRVFDKNGNDLFSFGAVDGQKSRFMLPVGLFIDSEDRIYVADQGHNKIQVWGWK